jgi:phosphatidylserine decarboxylase
MLHLHLASVVFGTLIGLFAASCFGWIRETQSAARRPRVVTALGAPGAYKLASQHTFSFAVAATGNALYKHRILGRDNVVTKLIQQYATFKFNAFHEPCEPEEILAFAQEKRIALDGWDKPIHEYTSIDDFFTRKYKTLDVVPDPNAVLSPSEGTVVGFASVDLMKQIWVKQKACSLATMGIPDCYLKNLDGGAILVFMLDVHNLHRFYAPVEGKVVARVDHLQPLRHSHSVRPVALQAGWDILTQNRRVILVIDNLCIGHVAMMVVGGIGIDSIEICVNNGDLVKQGDEVGSFHMGGSALVVALPRNESLRLRSDIAVSSLCGVEFACAVGDTLASHSPQ